MYSRKPLPIEDAVKLLVQSIQATSDPELFSSWALTAVIAELGLDLELLTGEELERLDGIDRLTDAAEHRSRFWRGEKTSWVALPVEALSGWSPELRNR